MATAGSRMRRTESLPLYTCIRFEYHEHFVRRCRYWMRNFRSTEATQRKTVRRVAVVNGQIVVGTFLVWLNFERIEMQAYTMTRRRCKVPHAVLFPRIVIGIVGTRYGAIWRCNFIFTAALFAIESIVMQDVSIVARAHIRSNRVSAFVHTAAVIHCTFVDVCDKNGGEATLLHGIVRTKFDAQFVAFRCNHRRNFLSTKYTMPSQLFIVHFRVNCQGVVITFLLMEMIAFQVEMREIQCDSILFRRNYLPRAIL